MRLSRITKNVDRRASKARKLRFDVHPKIVNFMIPMVNTLVIEGRDQIIENLFNGKGDDQVAQNR